jgi:hypothetical protein
MLGRRRVDADPPEFRGEARSSGNFVLKQTNLELRLENLAPRNAADPSPPSTFAHGETNSNKSVQTALDFERQLLGLG